ncbi:protein FAM43A-like, partial [Uloborus diversus]|uniref:protein FAM43A-like n=1 Tax=Uloborus diversus TaxID=327109 RepID=UPI00240A909B
FRATLLSSELDRHPPSGTEEDGSNNRASPLLEELRRRLGRTLRSGLLQFWKKRSVTISDYDPSYRVLYLGNIATPYAKGEGCADKPLGTLWRNRAGGGAAMELTVCNSGMRASTQGFGTTEYWAYRVTYCDAPADYPGLFCWIYRHERPKMKQELRCHAALCLRPEQASELAAALKERLSLALQEFRREKCGSGVRPKNKFEIEVLKNEVEVEEIFSDTRW